MNSVDDMLRLSRRARPLAALRSMVALPRLYVYLGCTLLALFTSYLLGKDMRWDTLDYHFYAGFSAVHDRFNQDYFPAGSQSYFNPYIYAPFYLLAISGLSALAVASILAVVQSGILWLTYELALEVTPADDPRASFAIALCAVLLAFANPILLNQFGSSYADITTAELSLAGWLLLVRVVRTPSTGRIVVAGLLLGAASALKLTNSVHAVSACVLLPFIPVSWRARLRYAVWFGIAVAVSFLIVTAPWSIRLEQHFGNPLFPLLNSLFRSPQYPTGPMVDHRFMPSSIAEALWRPFAIVVPRSLVDDELPAPDLRYALLLVLAIGVLARYVWLRVMRPAVRSRRDAEDCPSNRAVLALGVAFAVDWVLWLAASGNGRYFSTMSCVAAVLAMALAVRLFATRPKSLTYALIAVFGVQFAQLYLGTGYRQHVPWDEGAWFEVSVPNRLTTQPSLYFNFGGQTNAYIAPFLAGGSGLVNLDGDYPLGPHGASGAHVERLIRRYSTHLRVLTRDLRLHADRDSGVPDLVLVNDALEPFSLRVDTTDCSKIVIQNESQQSLIFVVTSPSESVPTPNANASGSDTGYLVSCHLMPDPATHAALRASERRAGLALDHLEDACPELFQPRRPATEYHGDQTHGNIWARTYSNTNTIAWIRAGWLAFAAPMLGAPVAYIGRESDWDRSPLTLACGWRGRRPYAQLLPPSH